MTNQPLFSRDDVYPVGETSQEQRIALEPIPAGELVVFEGKKDVRLLRDDPDDDSDGIALNGGIKGQPILVVTKGKVQVGEIVMVMA